VRILVAEPLASEGVELLRSQHAVDERIGLAPDELRAIIGEYDALVVRSQVQVDAQLIAAGTRLVVIGRAGVGVDNVKFRKPVHPGDQVVFEVEVSQIRGTVCKMHGVGRVDGEVVVEADMAAMVRDR